MKNLPILGCMFFVDDQNLFWGIVAWLRFGSQNAIVAIGQRAGFHDMRQCSECLLAFETFRRRALLGFTHHAEVLSRRPNSEPHPMTPRACPWAKYAFEAIAALALPMRGFLRYPARCVG